MDIQQLKQLNILVIGDSCTDVYHYGSCDRLSPEAPVPVFKELNKNSMPGMSANVAENLKSIGINVVHATNKNEIYKHRFIDSKSRQHLLRVDTGENDKTERIDISSIKKIKNIDAVIISDYNKGFLEPEDCKEICKFFNFKKIPVFVDSKKRGLNCYHNCVLKINEKEFNNATIMPIKSDILITLGERGVKHNGIVYPTNKVEVFDVCGAGDVFLSILVSFFLLTNDLKQAIIYANACASHSVTKMGTYVITLEDLNDICF